MSTEALKLDDIEQYRMQMAGICTAAIGYWKEGDPIHPDYDTLALRDVAKLYAKYAALAAAPAGGAEPVSTPEGWKLVPETMTDEMLHETWRALAGASDHVTIHEAYRRMLKAAPTAQPSQPEPSQEFNRGWDAAIEAHRLPHGAERRQDHDWRPRELQEEHGEVTLPFAEFKRLVAAQPERLPYVSALDPVMQAIKASAAQTEVPAEPSALTNDWRLPGDFTCRGATFRAGVNVRNVVSRMERLYDTAFPGVVNLTQAQMDANLATLRGATTPPQGEPDSRQNCRNFTAGKDGECVHCYAVAGQGCQYEPTSDDALSDRYVEQRNEIARLTTELTDEKAVVDCLRSELADRLQKQRAAEAELQKVWKDAAEWQLIETAPKERELLLFRADAGIFTGIWTSFSSFATQGECDICDEDVLFSEGWFYGDYRNCGRLEGSEEPTHWRELPLVPVWPIDATPEAPRP